MRISQALSPVSPFISPDFRRTGERPAAPIVGRTKADRYTLPVVANDTCTRVAGSLERLPRRDVFRLCLIDSEIFAICTGSFFPRLLPHGCLFRTKHLCSASFRKCLYSCNRHRNGYGQ
jgi:hypothetical protein